MMIWWSALTILAKDSASESALRTMELDPPNIRYLHQASPSSVGEAAEKSPGRGFSGSRKRSAMVVTKVFLAASQSVTNALRSKVTDWLPQSVRTNRPFISEVLRRYPAFSALRPPASSRRTCGVRQIAYPMMTGPSLVVASLSIHLDPLWRDRWFCREADFSPSWTVGSRSGACGWLFCLSSSSIPSDPHFRSHTLAQSRLFANAVLTGCLRFFAQFGGDSVRCCPADAELLGCLTG